MGAPRVSAEDAALMEAAINSRKPAEQILRKAARWDEGNGLKKYEITVTREASIVVAAASIDQAKAWGKANASDILADHDPDEIHVYEVRDNAPADEILGIPE